MAPYEATWFAEQFSRRQKSLADLDRATTSTLSPGAKVDYLLAAAKVLDGSGLTRLLTLACREMQRCTNDSKKELLRALRQMDTGHE